MNIFEQTQQVLKALVGLLDFLIKHDYSGTVSVLEFIAAFVSTLLLFGIVYCAYNANKIFKKAHAFDAPKEVPPEKTENIDEWNKILKKGDSEDENERKFAVIAADSLMEKILEMTGYSGENLGERLKKIEAPDLKSLNFLWEAHKIRNRIAHEADYKLSKEDAKSALSDFEQALKELQYI